MSMKRTVWYCTRIMKAREVKENAQAYMDRENKRKNEKAIATAIATA